MVYSHKGKDLSYLLRNRLNKKLLIAWRCFYDAWVIIYVIHMNNIEVVLVLKSLNNCKIERDMVAASKRPMLCGIILVLVHTHDIAEENLIKN